MNSKRSKDVYTERELSHRQREEELQIKPCELRFAKNMLAIYRPYVEKTAVTFEIETPSLETFSARVERGLTGPYPWLVACIGERIIGYAYAGAFKDRAAYQRSVETSIYLDPSELRKGYGKRLHTALEQELYRRGFRNLYACIAYPDRRDPYLTRASVRFHAALGYRRVGKFTNCAKKFNRLYSMIWMGKTLG